MIRLACRGIDDRVLAPLYELGYGRRAAAVLAWVHGQLAGAFMVGRNALIRLDNMNHAFTMAADLARHLAAGGSPGQWHRSLARYRAFSYID